MAQDHFCHLFCLFKFQIVEGLGRQLLYPYCQDNTLWNESTQYIFGANLLQHMFSWARGTGKICQNKLIYHFKSHKLSLLLQQIKMGYHSRICHLNSCYHTNIPSCFLNWYVDILYTQTHTEKNQQAMSFQKRWVNHFPFSCYLFPGCLSNYINKCVMKGREG